MKKIFAQFFLGLISGIYVFTRKFKTRFSSIWHITLFFLVQNAYGILIWFYILIFFSACLWICQPLLSCLSTRGSWPLASASITSKISLLASTAHPLWEAPLTTQRLMATAWIKHNYCLSCNKILNKKQNKNIIHQNYYY